MFTNQASYRRRADQERWHALQQMTAEETIAIGEALLTSELMNLAVFPDDDHPRNLAISLGIASQGPRRESESERAPKRV